ncbi:MAG: YwaF family protein [Lachnospiraceae bacterium]|nr:YwaF family protein [Lachnospiraceae bacterium]
MFWLHGEDLPADVGNERFCAMHLAYIAVFLIATVLYALFYRKLDEKQRRTAERITGSLVFFFGFCEYFITFLVGRFTIYTLPIHVCSLMYMLVPLHAWTNTARPGSFGAKLHAFLGAVIFHPGILGAWAALLFPDWLYYPFWNYLSICGFMGHGMVSVYGASVLLRNAEAPEPKKLILRDFARSAAFLLSGILVMYFFDRATDTNYWFMAGPGNDSPLTFAYEAGGYGGYLLTFIGVGTAVTFLWYGLRYLFLLRRKHK